MSSVNYDPQAGTHGGNKTLFSAKVFIIVFVILAFSSGVFPQIIEKNNPNDNNFKLLNYQKEYFFIDPLVFYDYDSAKSRLDLYAQIPLNNLLFKKNKAKDVYEALIDYGIVIRNIKNESEVNNNYSEIITNSIADQKRIDDLQEYITQKYYLPPGKYAVTFILRDRNSGKDYSKDVNIEVPDFKQKDITFSDLMILADYKDDAQGKKVITPLVNNNAGNMKDFQIFFEIYNNKDVSVYSLYKYSIKDSKEKEISSGNIDYNLQPGVSKKVEKLIAKDFVSGEYTLEIIDSETKELMAKKTFFFRWSELPGNISDLSLAISQIVYIATSDEFDYVKKGKTATEREKRFIKFWKSKDPTPNTVKNERMIDYYNRVRLANERYSHYVDGWKTDMGMVYITYGDPSSITREPMGSDTRPYEIWDYYEINRQFIFVDDTGFGDYRLTTPIWDDRNRHRF